MEEVTRPATLEPAFSPETLRLGRLSLDYLIDNLNISRQGADVVDRLLMAAILDANVAPIRQDVALQRQFAELKAAPPNELHRPVSVNAVAQSLGMPFETTRRRIRRLVEAGVCIVTDKGVLVHPRTLGSPAFKLIVAARYERLRRFYADLAAEGLLPAVNSEPSAEDQPPPNGPPVRIANRILAKYVMRCIEEMMRPIGDPLTALLLLHMIQANVEDPAAVEGRAPLQAVTALTLAEKVGMPPESARRRVKRLESDGYCRRQPGGFVVQPERLRESLGKLLSGNAGNVQRMFNQLARLGVLAYWKRESVGGRDVA